MSDVDQQLLEILGETDAAFRAIATRNAERVECRAGCSDCCRARLSLTHVEAALLRRGLATLPADTRAALKASAQDPAREMCPALDLGACRVYAFRPLICRSHGVPLSYPGRVLLVQPERIDVCDKNFRGAPLKSLPRHDIIDQVALVERLAAIESQHCAEQSLAAGERVPLALILRSSAEP